ncbi:MAG: TrkA family potassium uptake protein [Actinobacteria bacterium]|nr:MAG: TrkA family potassium uptake protein [Actinomycetota bacterium]
MRIVIAGAGKVGRSIARELSANGHDVVMLDRDPEAAANYIEGVRIQQSDACEIASLESVGLDGSQVVIAATGDDKANLVVSLLAKTEFGVPRVVARVNHPKNEWLFDSSWGVDVAVSTPRLLSALVEEAVTTGDVVRLFSLREGNADLVELTLASDSRAVGERVGDVSWPTDTALVAIIRGKRIIAPTADDTLEMGDELVFVAAPDQEGELEVLLSADES